MLKLNLIIIIFILTNQVLCQNNYWQDPGGLFPIIAYDYPDSVSISPRTLKIIKDGGINILINANLAWYPTPKLFNDAFRQLNDPEFRWIVQLTKECTDGYIFNNWNDNTNANIKPYLREFNNDFVYGWYIWDEPGVNKKRCTFFDLLPNNDFEDINTMSKQIRKNREFNKKLDYVNLFPCYWEDFKTPEDYGNYIDDFISSQEFKPRILSADIYPFREKNAGGFRSDYFQNLEILRQKSLQYNIPLWILVLSSGHLSYVKPTFEQIRMQVYSALAYGAKGIGYYLYSKSFKTLGYTSWILEDNLDKSGLKESQYGTRYQSIKKFNKEIQILGKILLNMNSIAVYHNNLYPNNQKYLDDNLVSKKELNYNIIKYTIDEDNNSLKSNAIIGLFSTRNNSKTNVDYIMLVNKDTVYTRNYNIVLNGSATISKINKITGKEILLGQDISSLRSTLGAGEGELFKIDNYAE